MAYTIDTIPKINCGHCKYFGKECKRIDHDKVKFYKPSFASYHDGEHHFPCYDFEPRNLNWADYKDWTGMDEAWPLYLDAWRDGIQPIATMFHVNDNFDVAYMVDFKLFFYGGMIDNGVLKADSKKFYKKCKGGFGYQLVQQEINGVLIDSGEEI